MLWGALEVERGQLRAGRLEGFRDGRAADGAEDDDEDDKSAHGFAFHRCFEPSNGAMRPSSVVTMTR